VNQQKQFFNGQVVWHTKREDFVRIVSYTNDPTSVLVEPLDFLGEFQEVSLHLLEKSIFHDHNHPPKE